MMFFKLPGLSNLSGALCKSCISIDPYMPLAGSAYFAMLIALSLLFPDFPKSVYMARGGLIWAIALAFFLTYTRWPIWCGACLTAHACHILIWGIWYCVPETKCISNVPTGTRLYLLLIAPFSAVALFSSLNLTFMTYSIKTPPKIQTLQAGDAVPHFEVKTIEGQTLVNTNSKGIILNFVSPGCLHCKEQLHILNTLKFDDTYRFINVSPSLSPEMLQSWKDVEWVEDKDLQLHRLFKVQGTPSIYIMGSNGTIIRVILGVPKHLKNDLQICLADD